MLRNWNIGNFKERAHRKRPTEERISSFLNEMGPFWKDYDVYLWGSWPQKKETWDVDFLVHAPQGMSTQEMENISIAGLHNSLVKNKFMADIGFNDEEKIMDFDKVIKRYNDTGEFTPSTGYIYGSQWEVDGKVFRDRNRITVGTLEELDNNMFYKRSQVPYPKMVKNLQNDKDYYKGKPYLISKAGEE
jgi:hypothetical protein